MDHDALVITPRGLDDPGSDVRGAALVLGNLRDPGGRSEYAPLHVHHRDDEAWIVLRGALRFRLADREFVAPAGTTVLVPAGVAHTFGNAGPEPTRYVIVAPTRVDALIAELHATEVADHPAVYRRHDSEVLE